MRVLLWCAALFAIAAPLGDAEDPPSSCSRVVTSGAEAVELVASNCTALTVTWGGHVHVDSTVFVAGGVIMNVTGAAAVGPSSSAVAAVVDGGGSVQLFVVAAGGTLNLHGLRLTGGNATSGGAVLVDGGTAAFTNCTFDDNEAFGGYALGFGGAIYNNGSVRDLSGCVFTGNSAAHSGGAIYNDGTVEIVSECTFRNNTAFWGGGLHNYGTVETMSGCTFYKNTAIWGGGLMNTGTVETMSECAFHSNKADLGGGLQNGGTLETMSKCAFDSNAATYYGGGISTGGTVLITATNFSRCSANARGGAVYMWDGNATFLQTTFSNNGAGDQGGAVFVLAALKLRFSCDGCTFDSCSASEGGAVFLSGGNQSSASAVNVHSFASSRFANCTGFLRGGCVHANHDVSFSKGSALFSCNAAEEGGAVYVNSGATALFEDAHFFNSSSKLGGALYNAGIVTLSSSSFVANAAGSSGGAVYSAGVVRQMQLCRFSANAAGLSGGAVYSGGSVRAIESCSFVSSVAGTDGGAMYFAGDYGNVSNCRFVSNLATAGSGGAVNGELSGGDGRFHSCVFEANEAGIDGGALLGPLASYVEASTTTTSTFTTTTTSSQETYKHEHPHKTTVRLIVSSGVLLQDCEFTGNAALGVGGAVAALEVLAFSSSFGNNTARSGGAVWAGSMAADDATRFASNVAIAAGGAVYLDSLDGYWLNSVFVGNTAGCCYNSSWEGHSCADVDWQSDPRDQCCTAGYWVFGGKLDCTACSEGFDCDEAGLLPETTPMDATWWRGDLSAEAARPCLNPAACSGGGVALASYCDPGYEGPLCAVCTSGYTSGMAYECHECRPSSVAASACVVAIAAIAVVAIIWYIASDLRDVGGGDRGSSKFGHVGGGGLAAANDIRVPPAGCKLKAQTLWAKLCTAPFGKLRAPIVVLQIVTQYVAITGTDFPPVYQNFLAIAGVIGVDVRLVISLGCLFSLDFYGYLLLVTIAPLVVVALLLLSLALARRRWPPRLGCTHGRPADVGPWRTFAIDVGNQERWEADEAHWERAVGKHSLVFMVFTFLIYSATSAAVFQTFACDDLRDVGSEKYLRADYSVQCYTPRHKLFMGYAAVMAVVYPIGIPALYAWMLWRQRPRIVVDRSEATRLADEAIQTTRFLWEPYKREVFWWEIAECLRRLCLTGVLVFIRPGTIEQAEWATFFSVVSLFAVFYFLPHEDRMDGRIYGLGAVIVFCSMYLSVVMQAGSSDNSAQSKDTVAALLVVLNVVMVAGTLAECLYVAFWESSSIKDMSFYGLAGRKGEGVKMSVVGRENGFEDDGDNCKKTEEEEEEAVVGRVRGMHS